ncbi:CD209 antigen-like protein E, partial [Trematomus bernacchii]|uniref:CD209 antigen-like protein E n=1 Tax=Trematomus bernacchii TaxID=40690 RepID=UPI001469CF61
CGNCKTPNPKISNTRRSQEISPSVCSRFWAAECFPAGCSHRTHSLLPLLRRLLQAADLSAVKANLTGRLQARDQLVNQLKASLTKKTREVDRLQSLMEKAKTCPEGWRMFGCSCYLFSTEEASWEQSRDNCTAGGAHLVIVDSNKELEFISSMTKKDTWIGLSDREEEGTWKWVDGSPLTLTFWKGGEPNNGAGGSEEDCAYIYSNKNVWNDAFCSVDLHWMCEKD